MLPFPIPGSSHSLKYLWWCDSIFDSQGLCPNGPNSAQPLPTCSLWSAGPAFCRRDNWNNSSPHFDFNKPSETERKINIEAVRQPSQSKPQRRQYTHGWFSVIVSGLRGQSVMWILMILLHSVVHMSAFFTANKEVKTLTQQILVI